MKKDIQYTFGEYTMRLIKKGDADNYYRNGFIEPSEEVDYFTGSSGKYTKEQIVAHVNKIVVSERYDFVVIDKEGEIVGEVVLNGIEGDECNYRIAIFNSKNFSKGIGYNATKYLFDYAREYTDLKTISLEVYPFNERGIGLYKKLGFKYIRDEIDDEAQEPYKKSLYMELELRDK